MKSEMSLTPLVLLTLLVGIWILILEETMMRNEKRNDSAPLGTLAKGFDLDGTDGDDQIVGTGMEDRIDGRAGNNQLTRLRDAQESRRSRYGERRVRAANSEAWRNAA